MSMTKRDSDATPRQQRILVWDLPTRLAHWLLVAGLLGAFLLAEAPGGFLIHVILGLVVALVALLRILWGLVGTTYARFSSFPLRPGTLVDYVRGAFKGTAPATVPHNPATAYATIVLLAAALGLAVTGLLMTSGIGGREAKEAHEVLVAVMIGSAGLHVVGLIWHVWRHRDGVAMSMVHGKKAGRVEEAIESPRAAAAVAQLALVAAWVAVLVSGYDPSSRVLRVPGFGWTIRAHDEHHEGHDEGRRDRDHRGDRDGEGTHDDHHDGDHDDERDEHHNDDHDDD